MLEGMQQKMRVELCRLRNEPQTGLTCDLIRAASVLGQPSYERYKSAAERTLRDLSLETQRDPVMLKDYYIIRCTRYPDAAPRVFNTHNQRCSCTDGLKECDQCAHEILLRGGFDSSCFLERHFARKCVRGSLNGWEESSTDNVGELIGFEEEDIHTEGFIQSEFPTQFDNRLIHQNFFQNEQSHINQNSFQANGGGVSVKPLNQKTKEYDSISNRWYIHQLQSRSTV